MDDLLIKDALLADGSVLDVAVRHGKIAGLGRQEGPARRTVRLDGRWRLSAGWIDGHVHCNPLRRFITMSRTRWVWPAASPR